MKKTKGSEEKINARFVCEVCKRIFRLKKDLLHHAYIHKENPNYDCKICGKNMTSKIGYERHMNSHRKDKKEIQCKICEETFESKSCLEKHHREKHLEEKLFACDICKAEFSWEENLHKHQRMHLVQNYQCEVCNKVFVDTVSLKVHQRYHVKSDDCENKPFVCKLCGLKFQYDFSYEAHLKHHMLSSDNTNKSNSENKNIHQTSAKHGQEKKHKFAEKSDSHGVKETKKSAVKKSHPVNDDKLTKENTEVATLLKSPVKAELKSASKKMFGDLSMTEEKPFKCRMCAMRFRWKVSLDVHAKKHMTGFGMSEVESRRRQRYARERIIHNNLTTQRRSLAVVSKRKRNKSPAAQTAQSDSPKKAQSHNRCEHSWSQLRPEFRKIFRKRSRLVDRTAGSDDEDDPAVYDDESGLTNPSPTHTRKSSKSTTDTALLLQAEAATALHSLTECKPDAGIADDSATAPEGQHPLPVLNEDCYGIRLLPARANLTDTVASSISLCPSSRSTCLESPSKTLDVESLLKTSQECGWLVPNATALHSSPVAASSAEPTTYTTLTTAEFERNNDSYQATDRLSNETVSQSSSGTYCICGSNVYSEGKASVHSQFFDNQSCNASRNVSQNQEYIQFPQSQPYISVSSFETPTYTSIKPSVSTRINRGKSARGKKKSPEYADQDISASLAQLEHMADTTIEAAIAQMKEEEQALNNSKISQTHSVNAIQNNGDDGGVENINVSDIPVDDESKVTVSEAVEAKSRKSNPGMSSVIANIINEDRSIEQVRVVELIRAVSENKEDVKLESTGDGNYSGQTNSHNNISDNRTRACLDVNAKILQYRPNHHEPCGVTHSRQNTLSTANSDHSTSRADNSVHFSNHVFETIHQPSVLSSEVTVISSQTPQSNIATSVTFSRDYYNSVTVPNSNASYPGMYVKPYSGVVCIPSSVPSALPHMPKHSNAHFSVANVISEYDQLQSRMLSALQNQSTEKPPIHPVEIYPTYDSSSIQSQNNVLNDYMNSHISTLAGPTRSLQPTNTPVTISSLDSHAIGGSLYSNNSHHTSSEQNTQNKDSNQKLKSNSSAVFRQPRNMSNFENLPNNLRTDRNNTHTLEPHHQNNNKNGLQTLVSTRSCKPVPISSNVARTYTSPPGSHFSMLNSMNIVAPPNKSVLNISNIDVCSPFPVSHKLKTPTSFANGLGETAPMQHAGIVQQQSSAVSQLIVQGASDATVYQSRMSKNEKTVYHSQRSKNEKAMFQSHMSRNDASVYQSLFSKTPIAINATHQYQQVPANFQQTTQQGTTHTSLATSNSQLAHLAQISAPSHIVMSSTPLSIVSSIPSVVYSNASKTLQLSNTPLSIVSTIPSVVYSNACNTLQLAAVGLGKTSDSVSSLTPQLLSPSFQHTPTVIPGPARLPGQQTLIQAPNTLSSHAPIIVQGPSLVPAMPQAGFQVFSAPGQMQTIQAPSGFQLFPNGALQVIQTSNGLQVIQNAPQLQTLPILGAQPSNQGSFQLVQTPTGMQLVPAQSSFPAVHPALPYMQPAYLPQTMGQISMINMNITNNVQSPAQPLEPGNFQNNMQTVLASNQMAQNTTTNMLSTAPIHCYNQFGELVTVTPLFQIPMNTLQTHSIAAFTAGTVQDSAQTGIVQNLAGLNASLVQNTIHNVNHVLSSPQTCVQIGNALFSGSMCLGGDSQSGVVYSETAQGNSGSKESYEVIDVMKTDDTNQTISVV